MKRAVWIVFWMGIGGCTKPPSTGPAVGTSTQSAVQTHPAETVVPSASLPDETVLSQCRKRVPGATTFVPRPIPVEMLSAADRGNETYFEIHGPTGQRIGYGRAFAGPLSSRGLDPDTRVGLVLVFDATPKLTTLWPTTPLPNDAGQPLGADQLAQLKARVQAPPPALVDASERDLWDPATGRLRERFAEMVVDGAARLTHRFIQLAKNTEHVLNVAPAVWDRRRLQALMRQSLPPAELAQALSSFLPTVLNPKTGPAVYRLMAQSYGDALRAGAAPNESVEARLLRPGLSKSLPRAEVMNACYGLATEGLRLTLSQKCAEMLAPSSKRDPVSPGWSRLEGTILLAHGQPTLALEYLSRAVAAFSLEQDPKLHLRWVQALSAAGRAAETCPTAQQLFREHPRLDGVREALKACAKATGKAPVTMEQRLVAAERRKLISQKRDANVPAPVLELEDQLFRAVEVDLAARHQITVVLFFSTWCRHCRTDLPQISSFWTRVRNDPAWRDRVGVIGIRTSLETEQVPFEQFMAEMKPVFPLLNDPTMSLAFGQFARAHGIPTALPTIAVTDRRGVVRFLLRTGRYRDVEQELEWAVEALIQ